MSSSRLLSPWRVTLITPIPVAALSNRWCVCQRVLQVWEKGRSLHTSGVEGAGSILSTRPREYARAVDTVKLLSSGSTGGARGIGKAISENLAQQGCKIVIIDPGYSISGNHDNKNLAEKVSEEISNKYNIDSLAITKDISIAEDVRKSIEIVIKKFGNLSIE